MLYRQGMAVTEDRKWGAKLDKAEEKRIEEREISREKKSLSSLHNHHFSGAFICVAAQMGAQIFTIIEEEEEEEDDDNDDEAEPRRRRDTTRKTTNSAPK